MLSQPFFFLRHEVVVTWISLKAGKRSLKGYHSNISLPLTNATDSLFVWDHGVMPDYITIVKQANFKIVEKHFFSNDRTITTTALPLTSGRYAHYCSLHIVVHYTQYSRHHLGYNVTTSGFGQLMNFLHLSDKLTNWLKAFHAGGILSPAGNRVGVTKYSRVGIGHALGQHLTWCLIVCQARGYVGWLM